MTSDLANAVDELQSAMRMLVMAENRVHDARLAIDKAQKDYGKLGRPRDERNPR